MIITNNSQIIKLNEITASSFNNCCPDLNKASNNAFKIKEMELFQYE